MIDFAALPPEVNSMRMYTGPGSGPLSSAAAGWDRLALELRSAADAYVSVIRGLTVSWLGPSSSAMATAVAPFIAWLGATATQAEQTAARLREAISAYEVAFASVVAPQYVSANRAQLAALLAGNILGQNAVPIAANEARYAEMWAQDAAAMYAYAEQSSAAADVTPFVPPSPDTDPATGHAVGAGAPLTQLMASVRSALRSLAVPAAANPAATTGSTSVFAPGSPLLTFLEAYEFGGPILLPARNALIASTAGMALTSRGLQTGSIPVAAAATTPPVAAGLSSIGQASTAIGEASSPASASLGRAGSVGALTVPPSWAVATPTVRLAAAALQAPGMTGAVVMPLSAGAGIVGPMAAAGMVGGASGAAVAHRAANSPASESDPAATAESGDVRVATQDKLKRVLADLAQQPETVQHWHTDKTQLDKLLEQLSTKPGVHAVHVSKHGKPNRNRPRWS